MNIIVLAAAYPGPKAGVHRRKGMTYSNGMPKVESKKGQTGKFTIRDLDLFLLGLSVCFAILFLIDSRTYNPTAALFPRLVAVVTLALLGGALLQHYIKLYRQPQPGPEAKDVASGPEKKSGIKWNFNLGIILAYFLLIYIAGFIWASLLYLLAMPAIMGYRKLAVAAAIAVFWVMLFVYVFYEVLQARIPKGLLEQLVQKVISS